MSEEEDLIEGTSELSIDEDDDAINLFYSPSSRSNSVITEPSHEHLDSSSQSLQERDSRETESQNSSLHSIDSPCFKKIPQLAQYFKKQRSYKRRNDAICQACDKVVRSEEIKRLIGHIVACPATLQKDKDLVMDLIKQPRVTKEYQDKLLNEAFARVIVENNLAINCVLSPSLRTFFEMSMPLWKIPSRDSLAKHYIPALSHQVKQEFESKKLEYLSVEFDHWLDMNNRSLLGIVVSQPDGSRYVFDLIDVSLEGHAAAVIVDKLASSLGTTKLSRINSIISDSASSCKAAREQLVKLSAFRHIIQHRCLAHLVNRIGECATRENPMSSVLKWATRLASAVSNSSLMTAKIRNAGLTMIKSYCAVRWYSQVEMFESIITARDVIVEEFSKSKSKEHQELVRLGEPWEAAIRALKVYKPLARCVAVAERKDGRLSEAFRSILDLGRDLFQEDWSDPFILSTITAYLTYICPDKLNNLEFGLLVATYSIDPRYSLDYLTDASLNLALEVISEIALNEGIKPKNIPSIIREYEKFKHECPQYRDTNKSASEWWSDSRDFGNLRRIAMRLANLTSSSANIERTFSSLKYIQGSSRFNLSLKLLRDIARVRIANQRRHTCDSREVELPFVPRTTSAETDDNDAHDLNDLECDLGESNQNHCPDLLTEKASKRYRQFCRFVNFSIVTIPQPVTNEQIDVEDGCAKRMDMSEILLIAESARAQLKNSQKQKQIK